MSMGSGLEEGKGACVLMLYRLLQLMQESVPVQQGGGLWGSHPSETNRKAVGKKWGPYLAADTVTMLNPQQIQPRSVNLNQALTSQQAMEVSVRHNSGCIVTGWAMSHSRCWPHYYPEGHTLARAADWLGYVCQPPWSSSCRMESHVCSSDASQVWDQLPGSILKSSCPWAVVAVGRRVVCLFCPSPSPPLDFHVSAGPWCLLHL